MTTDTATLHALLARVESADGPDRELDVALATLAGIEVFYGAYGHYWVREPATGEDENGGEPCPAYTASIDAALALVERLLPGWATAVFSHGGGKGPQASILPLNRPVICSAISATQPLAILAALLKALIDNNA